MGYRSVNIMINGHKMETQPSLCLCQLVSPSLTWRTPACRDHCHCSSSDDFSVCLTNHMFVFTCLLKFNRTFAWGKMNAKRLCIHIFKIILPEFTMSCSGMNARCLQMLHKSQSGSYRRVIHVQICIYLPCSLDLYLYCPIIIPFSKMSRSISEQHDP